MNAGPDKLVCKPGDAVTLDGKITGSPNEFYWEPATNLNNSKILTPRAIVFGPLSYILVAKGLDPTNLIINGNFSSGNTGFYTDYTVGSVPCYNLGYLDCEGTYDVITNPQLGHANWSNCGDHTSGSGNMMVVNGAASLQNVWCQQIPVMPGMDYKFSGWCAAVTSASPPILQIAVNGTLVGDIFNSGGAPCNWEQFGADFNSGANGVIEICITNLNTATGGNDFALDDLTLQKICEKRDTVEVDIINIVAEIADPEIITCDKFIIELDGTGSSQGSGWTYQWTASPGKIISGDKTLKPTIDGPGFYNLTVCSPLPNCCKTITVEVQGNKIPPNISLSTKDTIGCGKAFALIKTSSSNNNVTYNWTGPNGYISDLKDPLVGEGGVYIVTVTDEYNCMRVDSIRIIENADNPKVDISFNHINCVKDSSTLNASSSIPNSTFTWTGPKGDQKQGNVWTTPDSGLYVLKTTTPSGCIKFDSIRIQKDRTPPSVQFKLDSINCAKDSASLIISSRFNLDSLFLIGSPSYSILDSNHWKIGSGGVYKLVLLGSNLCQDTLILNLIVDTTSPVISAVFDSINCKNPIATLDGKSNDPLANYSWKDPNGKFYNQNIIKSSVPGKHILFVQSNNACVDSLVIDIPADTIKPDVQIQTDTLNCKKTSFTINHSGNDPQYLYQWLGPNGFNSQLSHPVITKGGIYNLVITASNACSKTLNVEFIEDFIKPQLNGQNDILTCSLDSLQLNATSINFTGTLNWSGPGNFQSNALNPYVKTPGKYTLVAQNPNGCSDSLILDIIADQNKPDLSVSTDTLNCLKRQINLSALSSQDSLRYLWLGPNGYNAVSKDALISTGGLYKIRVTNPSDCFTELEILILQDTIAPTFNLIGDSLHCKNLNINLDFTSASNPNQIFWTGPNGFNSNQKSPSIQFGGWYKLQLTSQNHCSTIDSLYIPEDKNIPNLNANSDTIRCNKRQVSISAGSSSMNPIFNWLKPDGSQYTGNTLTTTTGGSYIITVTASNYCTNSTSIFIATDTITPEFQVRNDTLTCNKQGIVLNPLIPPNSGYQFQWMGPGGFTSQSQNPQTSTPGNYRLQVTGTNGCSSVGDLLVSIDTVSPHFTLKTDSINCRNTQAQLEILGALSNHLVQWIDPFGNFISSASLIQVSSGGRYQAEVLNPVNGCKSNRFVNVVEDSNIIKDLELSTSSPKCGELTGSVQILRLIGGHGGYQYSIDGGLTFSANPGFNNLQPGTYQLLVLDQAGCSFTKTFDLQKLPEVNTDIAPLFEIFLGDKQDLHLNINLSLSKIKTIQWSPSVGLSCTDCLNPSANPLETTEYTVVVTDENGCTSESKVKIIVKTPQIWVPNAFSPNGDQINDKVWVHGPQNMSIEVEKFIIFDRWGNLVFQQNDFPLNDPSFGWDGTYKSQNCIPGVYVFYVQARAINGKILSLEGDLNLIR